MIQGCTTSFTILRGHSRRSTSFVNGHDINFAADRLIKGYVVYFANVHGLSTPHNNTRHGNISAAGKRT